MKTRPQLQSGDVCRLKLDKRDTYIVVAINSRASDQGRSIVTLARQVGKRTRYTMRFRRDIWFTGYNIYTGQVDLSIRGYQRSEL
jgi:hypothetical protein